MRNVRKICMSIVILCVTFGAVSCGQENNVKNWTQGAHSSQESEETTLHNDGCQEADDNIAIEKDYLSKSADGKTYEFCKENIRIDGEVFLEENSVVYIMAEKLSSLVPNISVEYDDVTCTISCPTYFFDENALLCVQIECIFQENVGSSIIKSYYYTNGNIYNVKSFLADCALKKNGCLYIPFGFLMCLYGVDYSYDSSNHSFSVSGGNISCQNEKNIVYVPIYPKVCGGYVWTSAGTYRPATEVLDEIQSGNFTSTSLENAISVTGGEKLKVTCYSSWMPEVATMVFMNDSNEVVSLFATSKSTYMKDSIITVPEKATKLLLTLYTNQEYAFYRQVSFEGPDLSKVSYDEYKDSMYAVLEQNKEKSIKERVKNYSFQKGYISFVIDDLRPDVGRIVDIFEEYGIPVCIAAPNMLLYSETYGEKSRYEICSQVVRNGGEILAHNDTVITEKNVDDMDIMFTHFFERSFCLREYGFEVNGIITAGGTGYLDGDFKTDLFVRTYYKYSDRYGEEKYGEPYYHPRILISHILDNYEKMLCDTAENKDWRILYFHDLSEISEEKLREILGAVKAFDEKQLEVVNYSHIYEMMEEE